MTGLEKMILAWDFDGVLVDTLHECHASYNGALKSMGLPGLTEAEFSFERKTAVQATDFFAQYFLRQTGDTAYTPAKVEKAFVLHKEEVLALREAYHRHRDLHLEKDFTNNPVYPGIIQVLDQLNQAGQTMAVISARDDDSLKKYLKVKELDRFFGKVIGSSAFFAKSHQLKPLQVESLGKVGKDDIWFIDDMPSVLFSLKDHARLFHAQWGYGKLKEFQAVQKSETKNATKAEGKKQTANAGHKGASTLSDDAVTVLKKPDDILSYVKGTN